MIDVIIPDNMWDQDSEGVILAWYVADGAQVEEGAAIAELTDEKVVAELEAPASGRLIILIPAGQSVYEGQIIARITPIGHR